MGNELFFSLVVISGGLESGAKFLLYWEIHSFYLFFGNIIVLSLVSLTFYNPPPQYYLVARPVCKLPV